MAGTVLLIFCYRHDAFEGENSEFDQAARRFGLDRLVSSNLAPLQYMHGAISNEFVRFCWKFDVLCDLACIRDHVLDAHKKLTATQRQALRKAGVLSKLHDSPQKDADVEEDP